MLKKIKLTLDNLHSQNDKAVIETEIDVLEGVTDINVNWQTSESWIEFDDTKISQEKIFGIIKKLGYQVKEAGVGTTPVLREYTYFVQGMHCASCEILIEKKLLALAGIKSVEASAGKGEVVIEYEGEKSSLEKLNEIFKPHNYVFFGQPPSNSEINKKSNSLGVLGISLLIIVGFLTLQKLGLSSVVNVSSTSSLPMFFIFGLLAGVSSCAALVGGLILSMSKQWSAIYTERDSWTEKLQPHLLFNAGRIIGYAILGVILGLIGSRLQISPTFTATLTLAVSTMMIFLALQMLGLKAFRRFQLTTPKFLTKYIADESHFKGRYMPFLMGALTFLLPCGFTITAEGIALISGSALWGGLIMLFFALGTLPALLAIGVSSIKFSSRPHWSAGFLKVAGVLVLFFALFNINSQLNVLGFQSFSDISAQTTPSAGIAEDGLAPMVDGKQILKMQASSSGYNPNYFKVRVSTPVRWEVTDVGTSGCTNAIISNSLFSGPIDLTPGQTSIKEFTPQKAGKYKFSCWMGMVSGVIEVVDGKSAAKKSGAYAQAPATDDNKVIPSGAKGCGCGGGNGSCGTR